jgi:hypothetical protein
VYAPRPALVQFIHEDDPDVRGHRDTATLCIPVV